MSQTEKYIFRAEFLNQNVMRKQKCTLKLYKTKYILKQNIQEQQLENVYTGNVTTVYENVMHYTRLQKIDISYYFKRNTSVKMHYFQIIYLFFFFFDLGKMYFKIIVMSTMFERLNIQSHYLAEIFIYFTFLIDRNSL